MAILQAIGDVTRSTRRNLVALWSDREGAAIVEFAIIGASFIALMMAILHLMLVHLAQQMLETSAESAGRLLLTGTAQTATITGNTNAGMTAADFKNAICNGATGTKASGESFAIPSLLPSMLQCSRLTVNVTTANSYNTASTSSPTFVYDSNGNVTSTGTGYSTQNGGAGQNKIVVLQLVYLWPTDAGPMGFSMVDQPNSNRMLVATSVFTTEDYSCSGSQTSC